MLKMQTLQWQKETCQISRSSRIVQHPVLSKYLASYLHRPVPELRLCAGTLRITRSQRPALGHQGIEGEGGDTQEVQEVQEVKVEVERGGLAADWPHGAVLPLLLSPSSLNCSASGDQSRAVIIVPVIMSRAMSALGLHITPTLSQQGLMVHGILVYGWVNKAIIAMYSRALLSTLDPHVFLCTRKPVRVL